MPIGPAPRRQITSWQAAEENAAAWMRWIGFHGARVTPRGADQGIDVRADTAVAQVKFEARQVGRPQLQNLVGARGLLHSVQLLFFTGAGYAEPALQYADTMGIALFRYRLDGTIEPVNQAAATLTRGVGLARRTTNPAARAAATVIVSVVSAGWRWLGRAPGGYGTSISLALAAVGTWSLIVGATKSENWHAAAGLTGGAFILVLTALAWIIGVRRWRAHTQPDRQQLP